MRKKLLLFVLLFGTYACYSAWVYTSGSCGPACSEKISDAARNGKIIYQQYNCAACHQIYGLGGYLGPELTTVISQPGKGEIFASAMLKAGTARMPDFHLKEMEIRDLVAFMKYVDSTAIVSGYRGSPYVSSASGLVPQQ